MDLREQFLGRRGPAGEVARVFLLRSQSYGGQVDPRRQVGVSCEALAKQGDLPFCTRDYSKGTGRP